MKAATRGDKPEWFRPPSGLTTARVCRLSGQLASDGCEDVDVVDDDGSIERRSMVYTEYFVVGTEPTSVCNLHPTRGFLGAIATIFKGESVPPPPPVVAADAGLPPTSSAAAHIAEPVVEIAPPPPEPKKRGFWSRVFGFGRRSNDDKRETSQDQRRRDEK
jgi:hypothetical protein